MSLLGLVAALSFTPCPAAADDTAFNALIASYERWVDQSFVEQAISLGRETDRRSITDSSIAGVELRQGELGDFLLKLRAIDPSSLNELDQLDWRLLERELDRSVRGHRFGAWLMPIGQRGGPHQDIPQLAEHIPLRESRDFEDLVARLALYPEAVRQCQTLLQRGLSEKITPPRVIMQGVVEQFDALKSGQLREIETALRSMPAANPAQGELQKQLLASFSKSREQILKELAALRTYLAEMYIPACRESISCADLPSGAEAYAFALEGFTTTSLTAEQIHAIGLSEVSRIRAEMMEVIRRTDWWLTQPEARPAPPPESSTPASSATPLRTDEGMFADFLAYLRTDRRFYFDTSAELLSAYRNICKRTDAQLPGLFGKLPRLPYGVREIPRFMAPSQTTAYYMQGSMETGLPGWFYANTYALDQRPKYEMIPLALHEAVPGHHLQISLAREMEGVRYFRRDYSSTAFVEGWALYSERLGIEMGFYEDPYDDFGRLLYEMWRSCRLVVDTGIHHLRWPRERAIAFMSENTALSSLNIEREIDRYIGWPGQACAYKIGEIRIRQLREQAEHTLGTAFDLRAFHDRVLSAGAIPLDLLELRVREWISECELKLPALPVAPVQTQKGI